MLFKRLKNKRGQIADILMFMFFFSFVIYFILAYTSAKAFFKAEDMVQGVVKNSVELVRTKGIYTKENFDDLNIKLSRYGRFNVQLTLEVANEKYVANNASLIAPADNNTAEETLKYVKYFTPESIIDRTLKVGDMIKVYVESNEKSLFGQIISRNFMLWSTGSRSSNLHIQAMSTAMICADGSYTGLEVLNKLDEFMDTTKNPTGKFTLEIIKDVFGIPTKLEFVVPDDLSKDELVAAIKPDPANSITGDDYWIDPSMRYRKVIETDELSGEITSMTITQRMERTP